LVEVAAHRHSSAERGMILVKVNEMEISLSGSP
jgi:hypothetical protein